MEGIQLLFVELLQFTEWESESFPPFSPVCFSKLGLMAAFNTLKNVKN